MGPKVSQRVFFHSVLCENVEKLKLSFLRLCRFSIKYFCNVSGHKSVFYFIHENGDVL